MSEADAPQQAAPQTAPSGIPRYDVASKERVVSAHMPTMDIVNERFARHFQSGLFTLMRRHADVRVGKLTVHRHSAFMGALAHPCHLNVVSLKPLRGSGLVVCGTPLLYGMVEALYGGPGRQRTDMAARELSATEQRVLTRLVTVVCDEYKKAWRGIHPMEFEYQRSETLPQFASVCGPQEVVVSTDFEVTLGELSGTVHVCMPYGALEPLRDVLYASPLGDAEAVDQRWLTMLTREIQSAEVTLSAQLATADVTVEQLLSMKPGDFIQLDRTPRISANVDGVPLFLCHYGTHNSKYAIRIDECLNPSGETHGQ
jgi:flagellar motor switch protein FliM